MQLVLASNNAGKLAELQTMFGGLPVQLVRQSELGVSEAEEPHRTFVENALAKARHAARATPSPGWPAAMEQSLLRFGAVVTGRTGPGAVRPRAVPASRPAPRACRAARWAAVGRPPRSA